MWFRRCQRELSLGLGSRCRRWPALALYKGLFFLSLLVCVSAHAQNQSLLLSGLDFKSSWQQLDKYSLKPIAIAQGLSGKSTVEALSQGLIDMGPEGIGLAYEDSDDGGFRLAALSHSGHLLWQYPEQKSKALSRATAIHYLGPQEGFLISGVEGSRLLGPEGNLRWHSEIKSEAATVLLYANAWALWSRDGRLLLVNPETGSLLSQPRPFGEAPGSKSRLWAAGNTMYGLEVSPVADNHSVRLRRLVLDDELGLNGIPLATSPGTSQDISQRTSAGGSEAEAIFAAGASLLLEPLQACVGDCWLLLARPAEGDTYAVYLWRPGFEAPQRLSTHLEGAKPIAWSVNRSGEVHILTRSGLSAHQLSGGENTWGLRALWSKDYRDLARRLAEPIATRMGLISDEGWPFLALRGGVLETADHIWFGVSVGYGVELAKRSYQHWTQHFLVAADRDDGAVMRSWPLPSALAAPPVLTGRGALQLALDGSDSRTAELATYQWLLPEEIRLEPSTQGLLSMSPKSYSGYIAAVTEHLRWRLSQRFDKDNSASVAAQLQSLYLLADLAHKAYWLDGKQLRKLQHWLDGSAGLLQQCMKSLDSSLHCEFARQRGQALDAIIPAFRS